MIPHQDYSEKPKVKKVVFEVEAESEWSAFQQAEELNKSPWSTWNYKAEEIK
jgi:hypothetical protein